MGAPVGLVSWYGWGEWGEELVVEVAKGFSRAKAADVGEILETLCAVGRARRGKDGGTYLP